MTAPRPVVSRPKPWPLAGYALVALALATALWPRPQPQDLPGEPGPAQAIIARDNKDQTVMDRCKAILGGDEASSARICSNAKSDPNGIAVALDQPD